ncbi:MAG: DUF1573 domain-containing protein, partial [Pirellulales bacterium]|nr:DUF1573 domain-containing protein [Pirellulales bacterium]
MSLFSVVAQAGDQPLEKVDYTPPKNTITLAKVDIQQPGDFPLVIDSPLEIGKQATFRIPLHNSGKQTVRISGVQLSCGCMGAVATA